MTKRFAIWATAPLISLCFTACAHSTMSTQVSAVETLRIEDQAGLNTIVDEFITNNSYPALYVRVEDVNGRVLYEHAAVNSHLLPRQTVNEDTWFRIWSMSKLVTISTVLSLVEDGIIGLDDNISDYLPEFASPRVAVASDGVSVASFARENPGSDAGRASIDALPCPLVTEPSRKAITVRDLINHQAGFYYATTPIPCLNEALAASDIIGAVDRDDFLNRLSTLPLIQHPGEPYFYGLNTTVLGMVAERATGQTLQELVRQRITRPLGIDSLQYGVPESVELLPRITGIDTALREAEPHELDIFGGQLPSYSDRSSMYLGGEGMVGTTEAYADFLQMILGRGEVDGVRILSEETINDMTSPHTEVDSEWGYNGYNLWVTSGKLYDQSQGVAGLWVGGGYEGTHFWIDPDRKILGLIMTQIHIVPPAGAGKDDIIREAVYARLK